MVYEQAFFNVHTLTHKHIGKKVKFNRDINKKTDGNGMLAYLYSAIESK